MKIYLASFLFINFLIAQNESISLENQNIATPVNLINTPEGFEVELLYSVPSDQQGSWVALCIDDLGRIIASDQYGGLYRFQPPELGKTLDSSSIKKIPVDIRAANGMLWAFDALYVAVNDYDFIMDSGLYRITDTDGDGELDKVELLRKMISQYDHGVHALLLSPDKKSIYMISGNNADLTEVNSSRVPMYWGEDHLLPRIPDGRGHNVDRFAPGGIIYKISPDGKDWEIISTGFRNIYDGAFNRAGELFTYDADMEWDFNTPWYRPTRVTHVTSGSTWGWRNGAGKRPEFYADNLPPVVNIGPGSPTGVTFGYDAKFPTKYREALFILDWSWGKIYAVHLEEEGSTYTGTSELFLSGAPLPVTDIVIHPKDGAMYFAIGGRKVQSGLYRITYTGSDTSLSKEPRVRDKNIVRLRKQLENYHGKIDRKAINKAWNHLDHKDRFIRWAARTAIMHQPIEKWRNKALSERNPKIQVEALLALAKVGGIDSVQRKITDLPIDLALRDDLIESLLDIDLNRLDDDSELTFLRSFQIIFNRFGKPEPILSEKIITKLEALFPSESFPKNWLLAETLCYLESPFAVKKTMSLLRNSATQEEQIEFSRSLRFIENGWTDELRIEYFEWFNRAKVYKGGASFEKFIELILNDAVGSVPEYKRPMVDAILKKGPLAESPFELMAQEMIDREFVKEWSVNELNRKIGKELKNRDFEKGRKMFSVAGCFSCHRFNNEGGMTGPDLTSSVGRFSVHDLLDNIINPSKVMSDQYAPADITMDDGELITGLIVNLNGDDVMVNTDMFNPNDITNIDRNKILDIQISRLSPMPSGLLSMLKEDEIFDLIAYILSGGDSNSRMFRGK